MITISEIKDVRDVRAVLGHLDKARVCVIKPNFFNLLHGYFTDARTLDLFLGAIPGKKIVIECYTVDRTDAARKPERCRAFKHVDWFRKQDRYFFNTTGIGEVLAKHGAQWVNVTEEVWAGRAADSGEVARLVEARYSPVVHKELYGYVPQVLFDLRGTPLLNLAKIKSARMGTDNVFFSLTMKNLFGLIPEPDRVEYHGKGEGGLPDSITDMCKIYMALFDTTHVAEAVYHTLISRDGFNDANDRFKGHGLVEGLGLAVTGRDPVEIDAYIVSQFGYDPAQRYFLQAGRAAVGNWDASRFPEVPSRFASFFNGYKRSKA